MLTSGGLKSEDSISCTIPPECQQILTSDPPPPPNPQIDPAPKWEWLWKLHESYMKQIQSVTKYAQKCSRNYYFGKNGQNFNLKHRNTQKIDLVREIW